MRTTAAAFAVALAFAAGCQSMSTEMLRATAELRPTTGNKALGEVTFEELGGGKVRLVVQVIGLKPDQEHGFHIHEAGDCSSGDGMSAKGHFNPFGKPHGMPSSMESHAGDLPSLKSDKGGRARLDVEVSGITVSHGPGNIIGRGLIVHAQPDDHKTQPTGNAGARLACAVIHGG
jgi:superoxide dismutase, Cu-Zn family